MMVDISTHQVFFDENGDKKTVLLSYEEYEVLLRAARYYEEYIAFEKDMIQNFREMKKIESGERKAKSLSSLLDEL